MEIVLNGASHQLGDEHSIIGLITHLELTNKAIAVAVNRNVIARQDWEAYRLQEQDQVDVVRAIGGG